MKVFSVAAALLSVVHATEKVDPASTTTMSPHEETAFKEVALYCEKDVRNACDAPAAESSGTPDLFWNFAMPPAPPSFEEVESFIDSVILSSLRASTSRDSSGSFFFIVEHDPVREERTLQHVLGQVAERTPPEKIPCAAKRIAEHGTFLLESNAEFAATQARMARRLSEVTEHDLQQRKQALLPFGVERSQCLRAAYASSQVSIPCGRAIYRLDQVRGALYLANVKFQKDSAVVVVNLICLYALVLATGMVIFWRRRADAKAKRRLTQQIFKAIYSKPHLKSALEKEMGESVGHVPPLPSPALWRMGLLGKQLKGVFRAFRFLRLTFVAIICVFFLFAPLSTLPVVVGYAITVFWGAVFSPKPTDICACCCCGVTTEDAKNGTLTAEQECCACCSGTGVCSIQCASCCEKTGDVAGGAGCCCGEGCCCGSAANGKVEGCCCCDDGCCCAGPTTSGVKIEECCDGECCGKHSNKDKPNGFGDECCCCCCCDGCCASESCCGGTGCGTCCCCMGTCSCSTSNGMKEYRQADLVIYEGVPVQIV